MINSTTPEEKSQEVLKIDRDSDLEAWEHSRIIVHLATFKSMMRIGKKDFPELWALYSFYYAKARQDNTNQPWAVDKYCMKGLGWGKDKFYRIKKLLLENKFIEQIQSTDEKTGKFDKNYIKVNYISNTKNRCPENKDSCEREAGVSVSPIAVDQELNALSVSQDELLKITSKDVAVEFHSLKNGKIIFSWPEAQKIAVDMHQTKEWVQNRINIAIERMENLPEPRTNPKGWIIEAVKNGWGDTEYKTGEQEDKESERRWREEKAADDRGFDIAEKRYADCPEAQTFFALRKGMIGKPTITETIQTEDENRLIELHKQRVDVLQTVGG